ncbi:2-oxoglutarate dehydrogenase complex dihydrolipoyllysine-residue succinyltransferase [Blattabacterium cuenoti]|uniref:2-oxoglutarate dehydrogenase complex dihydrolipoyllysine-residue succinyltransferase n=1 Tax=Blattabacterium cuenoti TaxID=1653831 RepID=UPI00163BFD52|nr:2-oxoglutarate dehydrogenase complex dihydrolipoyllysine-residue succinyltransferase [Blattabacterium cuenoti]
MILKVKVPSPGESINEVEISSWTVKNGEFVSQNQIIAELDSDKATLEITAEQSGIITILVEQGKTIPVGTIICNIDTSKTIKSDNKILNKHQIVQKNVVQKNIANWPSPSAQKIINEHNLIINNIKGTGKNGRITKTDCINSIKNQSLNRSSTITPLSSLRKKVSERLVSVKNQTAMLTTFNEVDMTEIILIRNQYNSIFQEKHGIKLGFMSFFTLASIRGLRLFPDVNAMISIEEKINFNYFDISIAISGPKGLMVPVIRNAENLSFVGIEKEIINLATRVKNGKISINEMKGGNFTITNGGIFGSMLSTPIINPPQSAILGMHKIMNRPIVIQKSIKIRPMMYLALSYDHRIIDGKESVGFLCTIKETLENPIQFLMGGNSLNIPKILEL